MNLSQVILSLRQNAKLSQEQLAEKMQISRQAVQKWENGTSVPDLTNLIQIAKIFGTTLDSIVFGNNTRIVDDPEIEKKIKPAVMKMHEWEVYSMQLSHEYKQSFDEGLDIESYKGLFNAVSSLPVGDNKEKLSDIIFDIVLNAPQRAEYKYVEPSDIDKIFSLRNLEMAPQISKQSDKVSNMRDKISGAWYGRICGCLLGKPIEGIHMDDLLSLLKNSENYPLHRYILSTDLEKMISDNKHKFVNKCFADKVTVAPADDDTNYTILYQILLEEYGRDFTPYDVSNLWVARQSKNAYCTAERVAFKNFVNGYCPPESGMYKNPFRELIGAQIRGDYFGYINPGKPEEAAEMAWRDACISHTKNGIYGEMFVAAMLAYAAVTDDMEKIVSGGLSQIPKTSRLYERIASILDGYKNGITENEFFSDFHQRYNDLNGYDWCHTISNAEIVVASIIYGKGDYGRSICMAVENGFDTDCNGATVGSILGMRCGISSIPEEWTKPINGTLSTSIFEVGQISIENLVEKTLSHIKA